MAERKLEQRTIIILAGIAAVTIVLVVFLLTRSSTTTPSTASGKFFPSVSGATTTVPPTTTTDPPVTTTTTKPPTTTTAPPAAPLPNFVAGSYSGREPSQIDLAPACCSVVDHITWSSWGSGQALGQGTWEYDTCSSGCVNGPFVPYSANLTLSGPLGGTFTALTVDTTGPQGSLTTYTYPQSWPYGAS